MVYLLHFDKPVGHVRHYVGATSESLAIIKLLRGDASGLRVPIVDVARARGIEIRVGCAWSQLYRTTAEVPYKDDRRRLCFVCLKAATERRRQ